MKDKLIELRIALATEASVNNLIAEKRADFDAEHVSLFADLHDARKRIMECKETLTEQAIKGYERDGEKKRLGGLGIRLMQDLSYEDKDAFGWAKEHSLCLKLDSSAFKRIAKTQDLDFVEKLERVCVTFPKEIILEE